MSVTVTRALEVAYQVEDLLNNMTGPQRDLFRGDHQETMDGFARVIQRDPGAAWVWTDPEDPDDEAARERQRRIDAGQIEMWPAGGTP